MRCILPLLVAVICSLLPSNAFGQPLRRFESSLEWTCHSAKTIVIGKIEKSDFVQSADGSFGAFSLSVKVDETIKGDPQPTLKCFHYDQNEIAEKLNRLRTANQPVLFILDDGREIPKVTYWRSLDDQSKSTFYQYLDAVTIEDTASLIKRLKETVVDNSKYQPSQVGGAERGFSFEVLSMFLVVVPVDKRLETHAQEIIGAKPVDLESATSSSPAAVQSAIEALRFFPDEANQNSIQSLLKTKRWNIDSDPRFENGKIVCTRYYPVRQSAYAALIPESPELTQPILEETVVLGDIDPVEAATLQKVVAAGANVREFWPPDPKTGNVYRAKWIEASRNPLPALAPLTRLDEVHFRLNKLSNLEPLRDTKSLRALWLFSTSVADISALATCPDLEVVKVIEGARDLTPLAGLTKLKELSFYRCEAKDLSFIKNLTALEQLSFDSVDSYDLAPMSDLKKLRFLTITGKRIADFNVLKNFKQLAYFDGHGCGIVDISPLNPLRNLRDLDLSQTQVADLSPLANHSNLRKLTLDLTQVADLKPLSRCFRLSYLSLKGTQVRDVLPLRNLLNLKHLNLESVDAASGIDSLRYCDDLWIYSGRQPSNSFTQLQLTRRNRIRMDHHVHPLSPQLLNDWKSVGMRFSKTDNNYYSATAIFDNVLADRILAISMAHLYTSRWFTRNEQFQQGQHQRVIAENDFIASLVQKHPQRIIGFFSVNPLADFAMEELRRCQADPNLTGLKLHLPACGFDINDEDHVAKLKSVFAFCNQFDVPILLHLDGLEGEFGDKQATMFWRDLVAPHKQLKLIVAHLGSTGGYSSRAAAVLDAFIDIREKGKLPCAANVYFDLSGAILLEETDGMPATNDDRCQRLAKHIKEVGVDRFLPASDYPALPADALQKIMEKLKLDPSQQRAIRDNVANFFDDRVKR
ncbi:MAG: amidohydrolase family protein [Planctomycetota bacterium]